MLQNVLIVKLRKLYTVNLYVFLSALYMLQYVPIVTILVIVQECQIAYPSVTGKVRNLRKSELIFGQFWRALSTHCLNQNVFACWGQGRKRTCT